MADEIKTSNSNTLSDFIWKIADTLWGDFRHVDFARIMLPLTLLRRLECVLEPTRENVLAVYNKEKSSGIDLDMVLPHAAKLPFFNTSESTNTKANLEDYISRFSPNVRKVFEEFEFSNTIIKLDRAKLLYRVTSDFANIDLHPDVVSERVMSNAYEHLIQKFAASVNEKAGEFMTPRDVVRLTTKLVLSTDEEIFTQSGVIRTLYDPTAGTAGFLSDGIEQIKEFSPSARVIPFGQELDPETHALALISMLLQGFDTDNIKQGSTLSNDQLPNNKFHYGLANPPFGIKWEKDQSVVVAERENLGFAGRFGAGLPKISDGSLLFLQHLVSKMESPENGGGRIGIVLSGSPLFNGNAGSGESEIRRWLLENDLVEAIFALPTDMFFNTGIGTYIWILSNKKEASRHHKVQLINLANTWTSMRKSEGSKRRHISEGQIDDILREYEAFEESDMTKIFNTTDFGYRRITVERPKRMLFSFKNQDKIDEFLSLIKDKYTQEIRDAIQSAVTELSGTDGFNSQTDFERFIADHFKGIGRIPSPLFKLLCNSFGSEDETAEVCTKSNGDIEPSSALRDYENVPLSEDINDYFEREVLPHVPDAWIDTKKHDDKDDEVGIVGYEINFNRYFYKYQAPRPLHDIDMEMRTIESEIAALLDEVTEDA